MQLAHVTSCCSVVTVPPHAAPPGTVTFGHEAGKPIVAGVRSSPPPQTRSLPPQALQILAFFLASALARIAADLESGHGPMLWPLSTLSLHFWSTFDLRRRYLTLSLPISR